MKKWIPRVIGPILLLIILMRTDLSKVLCILGRAELFLLLLSVFLNFLVLILRSHRWSALLRSQNFSRGFFETLSVYASSVAVGAVTPGRVGEFIKVGYTRRQNCSIGDAFFSVVFDRLYDIGFLFLFGGLSLIVFFGFSFWQFLPVSTIFLALSFVVYFVLTNYRARSALLELLVTKLPERWKEKITRNIQDFSFCFSRLRSFTLAITLSETVVAWLWNFFAINLASLALGLGIGYWRICAVSASCALVSMLPISILGVGTRDAVLIVLLGRIGILEPSAIALSSLIFLLNISYSLLCSLFLFTQSGRLALKWRPYKEKLTD